MKSQMRDLVACALYPTKAYNLPAVCERYGLAPGNPDEAFSSKMQYVMKRLTKLSDETVLGVARNVIKEFPDDNLKAAIEKLDETSHLVSDLTRLHVAEALNPFHLAGKRDLLELLRKHWPEINHTSSQHHFENMLADDIYRHAVNNDDWENAEIIGAGWFPDMLPGQVVCISRRYRPPDPAAIMTNRSTSLRHSIRS